MVKKRLNLTEEQKNKCETIIHTNAGKCAGVGVVVTPMSLIDNAVITTIQIAMIKELGLVFDQIIDDAVARSILSGASAAIVGRRVAQVVWGWIPILGNTINTATAAGLTEAIGWLAVDRFSTEKLNDENVENAIGDQSEIYFLSGEDVVTRDNEIEILKEHASIFFKGEKTYTADKAEYDQLLADFETILSSLPAEHELRKVYNDLVELPLQ